MLKRQLGSPVTHRRGLGRLGPLSPLLDLALATAFAITARHCPEARGPKRPKQLSPDRKGPESPSPVSLPLLEPSRSRKETCTTAVAESTCLWACSFRSQARAEAKEAKRKRCPVPTLFGAIKESRNGTRARKLGSQHRSHWACDLRLTEQQEWAAITVLLVLALTVVVAVIVAVVLAAVVVVVAVVVAAVVVLVVVVVLVLVVGVGRVRVGVEFERNLN